MSHQEHSFKDLVISTIHSEVTAYEIIDGNDEFVTSYSAALKKNTQGKLDGLKLAKDAVKYKQDYKILEVYNNGYRKLLEI
jgi:hypothetical protein